MSEDAPVYGTPDQPEFHTGIVRTFAALGDRALVTRAGLAHVFGRTATSIDRAVDRRELPPPTKIFGTPVWTVGSILRHIEEAQSRAAAKTDVLRAQLRVR